MMKCYENMKQCKFFFKWVQAKFLNPSYYQDAVEERALNKQCGFPLCPKLIEKVWKQKYTIDLSSKKVFDVTLRKVF